ncbi:hypothetical protein BH10CYA1_BH10CYA1_61400 [soil metagenome]
MFLFYVPSTIPYLSLVLGTLGLIYFFLKKRRENPYLYTFACLAYGVVAIAAAFFLRGDGFDFIRLLSIGAFPVGFLLFAMFIALALPKLKVLASYCSFMCLLIAAIGIDAFLIEPKALQVDHVQIQSTKIKHRLRVAVVTDLQTDHVSDYEKSALEKVLAEKPDIIVFPGDYVQSNGSRGPTVWEREKVRLNQLFKDVKLSAPLGVYAVGGNCEDENWPKIFAGLPVTCFAKSDTVDRSDFVVTGLTLEDSFNQKYPFKHSDKYQIVVGHGPDYAMANTDADLLTAGHTHGGQVQLPFYGPPMTLCRAPREWAKGCVKEIRPGTTLILSRGVGMERHFAPRMRFLCKPQIIIADIVPTAPENSRQRSQK